MAQGSLTARPTGRAGAKAGHSDPAVTNGSAVAQRIKGTPGITGLSFPRVHIDGRVWHLNIWGGPAEMSVTNRLITVEPSAWVRSDPHRKMGNTVGSRPYWVDPVTTEAFGPRRSRHPARRKSKSPQYADPSLTPSRVKI